MTRTPFGDHQVQKRALSLCKAMQEMSHEAEIVSIPFSAASPSSIVQQVLAFRLLDVSESVGTRIDKLVCLTPLACLLPHPAKVLWAAGRSDHAATDRAASVGIPLEAYCRGAIQAALQTAGRGRASTLFASSKTCANRLLAQFGLVADTLYYPPPLAPIRDASARPGGIVMQAPADPDRCELVLSVLAQLQEQVRVIVMGDDRHARFKEKFSRLKDQHPHALMSWQDVVSDEQRAQLLGAARAVVFVAANEDDATPTLAAMASGCAVVTCVDSGAPTELVRDDVSGYVCEPSADAVAAAINRLWAEPDHAIALGDTGEAQFRAMGLSWKRVVECLLSPS